MSERVSIIITTFKRPELLNRSLRSALSQTYSNVEVIVVDDNDPDSEARKETEKLVAEVFGGFANLLYLKMPQNGGACAARNLGVSKAEGKFIQFLDDDDEMLPDKIAKQVAVFEASKEHELSAVGCYGEIVDGDGNHISITKDDIRGDVFFWNMCDIVGVTSQMLIRKSTYLESGGFEKMHASQDHWMLIRLFSVSPWYDYVPESLVKIYHHAEGRISTNSNKPNGSVELYDKCLPLLSRLTPEQAQKVKLVRNDNIISAFLHQGRRKESYKYWKRGISDREKVTLHDMRILLSIVLGERFYGKMVGFLAKVKHLIIK